MTGIVNLNSDLIRRRWMREGMIQAASKSFWSSMQGSSKDAIVYQVNNENSGSGHTVVFDYTGNLSGKAVKGKETAFGKGEQKRKFSDKITVERYRLVVDNGDKFDGVNIGDLSINEHSQSRTMLGDLWARFKDQSIFDAAQGNLTTLLDGIQAATHVIDLGTTFNFNQLVDIETTIKTSQGFSTGSVRRPLDPFRMENGEPVWPFVVDAAMVKLLRKDSAFQTIMRSSDVRGNGNRNIKGVIGKVGSLLLIQADQFFGFTPGTARGWGLDDSEIEIAGLRQYQGANPATAVWTGQANFNYAATNIHSRGLILGAGALQLAMGKMPDYKFQESQDFGIKSESALEVWMESRKCKLTAENSDYKNAKVAGIDHAIIAVDVQVN